MQTFQTAEGHNGARWTRHHHAKRLLFKLPYAGPQADLGREQGVPLSSSKGPQLHCYYFSRFKELTFYAHSVYAVQTFASFYYRLNHSGKATAAL